MKIWQAILVLVFLLAMLLLVALQAPNYGEMRANCDKKGGVLIRAADEHSLCIKKDAVIEGDFRG